MEKRDVVINSERVSLHALGLKPFRKRPVEVLAVQVVVPFEVQTLEGLMKGKPGDYLIVGVKGEAYPCDQEVFNETYDLPGPVHAVFQCRKCQHLIYVGPERIAELCKKDCPECGEESDENWVFIRMGDYDEDIAAGRVSAKDDGFVNGGDSKHG